MYDAYGKLKVLKNSMKVVPGILANNITILRSEISTLAPAADFTQIDIVDGKFCPGETVKVTDLQTADLVDTVAELHLMVVDPAQYIADAVRLGFKRLLFHWEAVDDPQTLISAVRSAQLEVGIAINPATDAALLKKYLNKVDAVLIMSVNPGMQGNAFLPATLSKANILKNLNFKVELGIDGGIKQENIQKVARAGFDYAVVGSAISQSKNPLDTYLALQRMVS